MRNLNEIIRTGDTQRYHTQPSPVTQNVASHSWGVVALIQLLHPNPSPELVTAALFHDCGEMEVGDMPYPAKRKSNILRDILHSMENDALDSLGIALPDLKDQEQEWLKYCDMAEMGLYASRMYCDYGIPAYHDICIRVLSFLEEEENQPDNLPDNWAVPGEIYRYIQKRSAIR